MDHSVRISTDSRLLKRGCESLLGICGGLIADGHLNDLEITFLRTWLSEHAELGATWPGEVVLQRVEAVLSDGMVTDEERAHLLATLEQLVGGSFAESGAVPGGSIALPLDLNATVSIASKTFCFTGQFLFGTRKSCETAVATRGGAMSSVKRSLDYLVVGDLSSKDWKFSSFGNKIQEAVALRDQGLPLKIVSESQWVSAL
jgi:NAD-dependent DNA ligase